MGPTLALLAARAQVGGRRRRAASGGVIRMGGGALLVDLAGAPLRDRLDRVVHGRVDVLAHELHGDVTAALEGNVDHVQPRAELEALRTQVCRGPDTNRGKIERPWFGFCSRRTNRSGTCGPDTPWRTVEGGTSRALLRRRLLSAVRVLRLRISVLWRLLPLRVLGRLLRPGLRVWCRVRRRLRLWDGMAIPRAASACRTS